MEHMLIRRGALLIWTIPKFMLHFLMTASLKQDPFVDLLYLEKYIINYINYCVNNT